MLVFMAIRLVDYLVTDYVSWCVPVWLYGKFCKNRNKKIFCLSDSAVALSHNCRFALQKHLDTRLFYVVPEDSSGSTLR